MPNIPKDLMPPATAVAVSRARHVKTNGWVGPQDQSRDADEYKLLAIAWSGAQHPAADFSYLVFDAMHHEVTRVAQSLVDGVYSSQR